MAVRFVRFSLFFLVFFPFSAWSQTGCETGFRSVVETLKVNEFATDLEPLVIYKDGQEVALATGGQGALSSVVNMWSREHNGTFTEQVIALDYETLEFDRADTTVQSLEVDTDGRITLQFCLPETSNAVTIHAIFGETETRGVQTTIGQVRDGKINAVANRATAAWFNKYNQGKERSGSEQILRIMKQHYGAMAPRALTERQVIALNEMYGAALVAGQLTGGNDLNIDVEGTTVYVEFTPNLMCFSDLTTGFWVNGANLLINQCVSGLENHVGKRYVAETDGLYKTGTIENADLGMMLVGNDCNGTTGTVGVLYGNQTANVATTFLQSGQETVVYGGEPNFTGNCEQLKITASVIGNQEQPLYRRSVTVFDGS